VDYPTVKDGVLYLADGSKMKRYGQFIDVCPTGSEYFLSYNLHPTSCSDEHTRTLWRMLDSVLKTFGL
jgi:hypothetical protein